MARFFALFTLPASVIDNWRATTPPDEMKKVSDDMMRAWGQWMHSNAKSIVDPGGPLGKTKRISGSGTADVRNDLTGYMIVEADSADAAAKLFAGHPHLSIPSAALDLMELPAIPRG